MPARADVVSVSLPDDMSAQVAQLALANGTTPALVVQEAVAAYLDEQRSRLDAIDEALAEADQGVFVSGEAVTEWLKSWGSGKPAAPPKPDIFS
jgi:predicted transcriptional regulator